MNSLTIIFLILLYCFHILLVITNRTIILLSPHHYYYYQNENVILNENFICPECNFAKSHNTDDSESSFKLEDGEVVEEVESFNYLRNCFDCDNDIERTVRGRIDAAWLSWRNISGLLRNNMIPLKYRSAPKLNG